MLRRWALPLLAAASLVLAAAPPSLAAGPRSAMTGTSHYQERGAGIDAGWTNLVFDDQGMIPAGDYYETYVSAASYVARSDGTWADQYLCVDHFTYTVDASGAVTDSGYLGGCGTATTLAVDQRFATGRVAGSFDVQACTDFDPQTGECLDPTDLGTMAVDLTLTGTGRVQLWHGSSSGGTAGMYQYTTHGTGSGRNADVAGSVTLEGTSLIDSPTMSYGWLFRSKYGSVDVWHM